MEIKLKYDTWIAPKGQTMGKQELAMWKANKSAKLLVQGNSSDKNMCYGRSEEGENIVHSGGRVSGYVEEEGLRGWF